MHGQAAVPGTEAQGHRTERHDSIDSTEGPEASIAGRTSQVACAVGRCSGGSRGSRGRGRGSGEHAVVAASGANYGALRATAVIIPELRELCSVVGLMAETVLQQDRDLQTLSIGQFVVLLALDHEVPKS